MLTIHNVAYQVCTAATSHVYWPNILNQVSAVLSLLCLNPLEYKGNYSATSNNMKLVHVLAIDGWAVTFGTARRGLGEASSALHSACL